MAETNTAAPQAVITLTALNHILGRAAAIDADKYATPPHALPKGIEPVGVASDSLRRFYSLYKLVSSENQALREEHSAMHQRFADINTAPADVQDRHDRLAERAGINFGLMRTINELIWLEVRMTYPCLAGAKQIKFANDWSIYEPPIVDFVGMGSGPVMILSSSGGAIELFAEPARTDDKTN